MYVFINRHPSEEEQKVLKEKLEQDNVSKAIVIVIHSCTK